MTVGTVPPVNRILLGMNINQTVARTQALWIGQWDVVDGTRSLNPFGVQ